MPSSNYYDKQCDRLDGLRDLLRTWLRIQPDHKYVADLKTRINNLEKRIA